MEQLAPKPRPVDIEAEGGLSLLQFDTDNLEYGIWNGEDYVGGLHLTPRAGEETTAQINFRLYKGFKRNGYLTNSIPALSKHALEELGFERLVVRIRSEKEKLEVKKKKYAEAFAAAGFMLAEVESKKGINVYQLAAESTERRAVRVILDEG